MPLVLLQKKIPGYLLKIIWIIQPRVADELHRHEIASLLSHASIPHGSVVIRFVKTVKGLIVNGNSCWHQRVILNNLLHSFYLEEKQPAMSGSCGSYDIPLPFLQALIHFFCISGKNKSLLYYLLAREESQSKCKKYLNQFPCVRHFCLK